MNMSNVQRLMWVSLPYIHIWNDKNKKIHAPEKKKPHSKISERHATRQTRAFSAPLLLRMRANGRVRAKSAVDHHTHVWLPQRRRAQAHFEIFLIPIMWNRESRERAATAVGHTNPKISPPPSHLIPSLKTPLPPLPVSFQRERICSAFP